MVSNISICHSPSTRWCSKTSTSSYLIVCFLFFFFQSKVFVKLTNEASPFDCTACGVPARLPHDPPGRNASHRGHRGDLLLLMMSESWSTASGSCCAVYIPRSSSSKMSLPTINSTTSLSTTRRKREAERSVNWTVEETKVLLCAWSDQRVQKSLSENLRNRHVFKHLSARMSDMGFSRSPHQCRLRVKTLKANYARAKLQRRSDASQMCTFKYFDEMDAVLGRPVDGSGVGPRFPAPVAEFSDQFFSSPGRDQLSSSEEKGGRHPWKLGFHVKMENGEDSEFSDAGFPEPPRERRHDVYLASTVRPEPAAPSLEVASSTPPAVIVAAPAAPGDAPSASARLPDDSCLRMEPALQHLSQCYQQLLSETRTLLTQLERQRQEQATWHQDLLGQWIQRQQEAAEREERREKAHMEHQIQVLELLTCLVREQQCKCGGGVTTTTPSGRAAAVSSERHHLFTKGEN
ncbi:uncharacterized protein LOC133499021 isoform X2 [Syngnathoides biaculeatus]|uniref:uncharacterized protein LOC133499021 isoform X2 n=1 Tax=Syngnathoides biaculeatus TaxID=300417 RepID=UPI002ADD4A58|nr:uncharacterized protein LOC133499021 isoform X2 [Syngnathoides biaculeatus]